MKLILVGNLRGAHAGAYVLLKETIADAYLFCGDLLDGPFFSAGNNALLSSLEQRLGDYCGEKLNLPSAAMSARSISDDPAAPREIIETAKEYLLLAEKGAGMAAQKYRVLDNILSTKPYVPVLIVPGPGDGSLEGTPLAERVLDGNGREISSIVMHGFSQASSGTIGKGPVNVPETDILAIALNGGDGQISASHLHAFVDDQRKGHPGAGFLFISGSGSGHSVIVDRHTVELRSADFGVGPEDVEVDGGYFYQYECGYKGSVHIVLKKLAGERVIDIAEYFVDKGMLRESVVDADRYAALVEGRKFGIDSITYTHSPELKLFRDIRNFFRIHQTRETEKRVETLQKAIDCMEDDRHLMALDLVGSTNVGLSGKSSDVDMVLYIRAGGGDDEKKLHQEFSRVEERLRRELREEVEFEVIDRIDLDRVEASISSRDFGCDSLQLFATYRSACRPVNYRVLAPLEDRLNQDTMFRREVEELMRSYLRMFAKTSDNSKSFEKYLTRLKTSGIAVPGPLMEKIRIMLQQKRT